MNINRKISSIAISREDSVDASDDRCIGITTQGKRCRLKISKKDLDAFWAMNASLSELFHLRYCKRQHRQLVNQYASKTDSWKIFLASLQQRLIPSPELCISRFDEFELKQEDQHCSLVENQKSNTDVTKTPLDLLKSKIEPEIAVSGITIKKHVTFKEQSKRRDDLRNVRGRPLDNGKEVVTEDPMMVTEYEIETYEYWRLLEDSIHPDANYMERQEHVAACLG